MMEDREPLALPFNIVDEFKDVMNKDFDSDASLNTSILVVEQSLNDTDSSKENSFTLLVDDIRNDSSPSFISKTTPVLKSCNTRDQKTRSRYSLRANKSRSCNETKSILVGDVEDDIAVISEEECYQPPSSKKRGRRRRTNLEDKTTENSTASNSIRSLARNEIIIIDDDDDESCCIVETTNYCPTKNGISDPDSINKEMNIKISWLYDGTLRYKLKKFEPFSKIFSKLAEDKKIDRDCIVLMKDDTTICPEDTPDSINLSILDVLTGYSVVKQVPKNQIEKKELNNSNTLKVKVITDSKRNKEMYFSINKDQKMLVLLIKVAQQLNYNLDDIQLWFDGERINEEDTTTDLDLEGDECFELRFKRM